MHCSLSQPGITGTVAFAYLTSVGYEASNSENESFSRSTRSAFFLVVSSFAFRVLTGIDDAQNGDLYIYPAKGQSQALQDKDRYECHSWAVKQPDSTPAHRRPLSRVPISPKPYRLSELHVVKGAAHSAALGAVGGAVTGDAGKGAAAGAAMGGVAGTFRRVDEKRQQGGRQQANAQAADNNSRNG
jgi:Glycine-zipper domain